MPSTRVVAKPPTVTPIRSALGSARSRASMSGERSMPCTGTPRALSGRASRPVPMPNSSAAPSPARSTAGSTTAGADIAAEDSS